MLFYVIVLHSISVCFIMFTHMLHVVILDCMGIITRGMVTTIVKIQTTIMFIVIVSTCIES